MKVNEANYRWKESGIEVMKQVVKHFEERGWNFSSYINEANNKIEGNFKDDPLLNIKNVGLKVRDLALSNFSHHFPAFDVHLTRIITRIGWLNFGYDLTKNNDIEMGNNASNKKNYLFLHKLLIKLSDLTNGEYTPVELDRTFWHMGRSMCGSKPKCSSCPIKDVCLTGKS